MRRKKKNCAQCFRILADRTRMIILKRLKETGTSGMAVGEVVKHVSVSQPTVSYHLNWLAAIGMAVRARTGREVRYAFNPHYPCKKCGVLSAPIKI